MLTSKDDGYGSVANFMAAGGHGNSMELQVAQAKAVGGVTFYQSYLISAHRVMTLNSMKLADNNGSALPLNQKHPRPSTSWCWITQRPWASGCRRSS